MNGTMQERQMALTLKKQEYARVCRRLEDAEQRLSRAKAENGRLGRALTKEQHDVMKLGRFSFLNKVKEWTGSLDQKMEKEIAEAAAAEVAFNESEKHVEDLTYEVDVLKKTAANPEYAHLDEDWAAFLEEKELWIRMNDETSQATLQKIADDRVRVRSMLRELDEAIEAGDKAVRALDRAIDKLSNAEGLSMWDTFLGGGLLVSALKYSEVNSSDDLVHAAQRALRHYETELMDVQEAATASFQVNRNDIFTFTDLFFDNIFSDFAVHSRITEGKQKLNDVLQDVRRVQTQLARKKEASETELERLDADEKRILLS
ncbi:hypothetical protein NCCP2716_29540 [Sporosarcina sp. NCCP-2716]|uniref:hypothetical protein n=1 Tax=Sporosarcina sp. NCCP-2716 TaxID=2943679 RepID=UPI00203B866D|nr:hypothetical protein [Sporosarcina sp. NCCP-2716]GKV70456.1 hypothetical protein NCCP2716_29540 [Sporosarcina sp. NCCP-2716]